MSKEFIWTDELVQQYCANMILGRTDHPTTAQSFLEHFKASHQPKEDKPEWQIVQIKKKGTKFGIVNEVGLIEKCFDPNEWDITSVQRKDGEVFSVGDEVFRETDANKVVAKIEAFDLVDGDMRVRTKQFGTFLHLLQKSKPKEELKEPEVSKFPIRFSKEASDFIQTTFNKSGDYYWTDFKYRKIGDTIYELHPPEKTYTQEQVNKMMEDAFNAARQIDFSKILPPFKVSVTRYPTFQDYQSSLK